MRGNSAVHPFSKVDFSPTSNAVRRSLIYGLLIATILTAYEQSSRQSAQQLERQIQQLQQLVNKLQSRIDILEKKNGLDRQPTALSGAAAAAQLTPTPTLLSARLGVEPQSGALRPFQALPAPQP